MSKHNSDRRSQASGDRDGVEGPGAPSASYEIGAALRQRRKEIGSTLDEVASAAGIGAGFLSDIERNKASPSVATLFRLCAVIDLSIGSLFRSEQSIHVRARERERMSYGGQNILFELLNSRKSRCFSAVFGELEPNASSGEDMHVLQSDEQFIYVIRGEMVWEFEGRSYHLREGDALTIDPTRKHRYYNPSSEQVCQSICIIRPPPE